MRQLLSFDLEAVSRKLKAVSDWAEVYRGFSHFISRDRIRFHAIGISNEKSGEFISFADSLRMISSGATPENSVFVKMDIELSEFRVLPDILDYQKYVNCLVIEFHDLDIMWPRFAELVERLKEHFEITHIHGNNYAGLIPNSEIPRVLEVTFLKRSLIHERPDGSGQIRYPIPNLDSPNDPAKKDYSLRF